MSDNQEGVAQRKPPDSEELSSAREYTLNPSQGDADITRGDAGALLLQMQQLNYDVDRLNENITDLNRNLKSYATWSRWLTLALIGLGLIQIGIAVFNAL